MKRPQKKPSSKGRPTRDDLLQMFDNLVAQARQKLIDKGQDYASDDDPFRNFRRFGGIGILARWDDKIGRLQTYEENGSFTVDETMLDTCVDSINYPVLYYAFKLLAENTKEKQ